MAQTHRFDSRDATEGGEWMSEKEYYNVTEYDSLIQGQILWHGLLDSRIGYGCTYRT